MERFAKIVAVNSFCKNFHQGCLMYLFQSAMCLLLGLMISLADLN